MEMCVTCGVVRGRGLTLALHQLPDSCSASDNPLTLATLSAASAGAELSSCTIREHNCEIYLVASDTPGDSKNTWGQ